MKKWYPKKHKNKLESITITPDFSLRDREIRLACEKQDKYPSHLLK